MKLLGDSQARHQSVSLIADLLGVELDDGHPAAAIGPTVKRHLTIEALVNWFADRSKDHAATIVFEDVQWIDPTSKLLLDRLANWAKNAKALVVITLRTDSSSAAEEVLRVSGLVNSDGRYPDHVTIREIRELDAVNGRKLAAAAAAIESRVVDAMQLEAVLAKSGGIPLYLEELVKAAAQGVAFSGSREETARSGAVPNTISDALMAQLDQLGFAKEVARRASVIGPEFSMSLLARIMGRSLDELMPMLTSLVNSRIIKSRGSSPDGYSVQARPDPRHFLSVAAPKEPAADPPRGGPGIVRHPAEIVEVSDDLTRSITRWGMRLWKRSSSGDAGRRRGDHTIGQRRSHRDVAFRARGVGKNRQAGPEPELELDLVLTQATALRSVRGYSAPEVEQHLARARVLCTVCGDFSNKFSVNWGLFQCTFIEGDIDGARTFAAELEEHAAHDPGEPLVDAYLAKGQIAFTTGEFELAMKFFEAGAHVVPAGNRPAALPYSWAERGSVLSFLSGALAMPPGYLDRGRATIRRARAIAATRSQDPGHIHSWLAVAVNAVRVHHLCDDLEAERRAANETVEMARQHRYAYCMALGKCQLGWVAGAEGKLDAEIAMLTEGLAALRQARTYSRGSGFLRALVAALRSRRAPRRGPARAGDGRPIDQSRSVGCRYRTDAR